MNKIVLNIKTNYQLLSSLIKLEDLITYAKENNIIALGITDSNLFSFAEFYSLCISNNILPIVGIDLTIDDNNFILYAQNYSGYQNLCKIVCEKNTNGLSYEFLKNNNKNLICVLNSISQINYDKMKEIFSDIYISYSNEQKKTEALVITSNVIRMNEVLCYKETDYEYLKYLYMIRDNKTINDDISYEIVDKTFNFNLDANEQKVYNEFIKRISINLPKYNFNLPKYCKDSMKYLNTLCNKGLEKRLNNKVDEKYKKRLQYELSIIENMKFMDYFLIVYDIVLYAKKNNIYVGPGRGSAVGSLVCYTLGITDIDPLKYNLLFERFLNPNRVSMPDIDIDISDTKREKLIEYVKNKYGCDKVANIITFSTLLPKQVLRDVGRVLDISTRKMDVLLGLLKEQDTLEDLKNNIKYKEIIKFNKDMVQLLNICEKLEGLKKHASIHAAGVVIDSEPLTNKVPLYMSGNNLLVGYDKKHIEEFGILKIDLLSIRNLSIIDEVLNEIKDKYKKAIELNKINLEDKKTLELFASGNTTGIFQFESNGLRNLLCKMNISSFNDLIIAIAMYRPGPMSMIPTYLDRREHKEKIVYPILKIKPILEETLGIMVYQEQLLEILNVMAGYTYSQADIIRVGIKNKNEKVLQEEKANFESKSLKLGYKRIDVENMYNMILKFASYGFNKSHSVAYATVGYQMGYLKANYSEIFMINLLNKEIGRETKTKEYIEESKILGLEFDKFDINESKNIYYIKDGKIILPFSIIKNVGDTAIKKILGERNNGKFTSFLNFSSRCYGQSVNKKVLESLIYIGAFDSFNTNKQTLINNLEETINYSLLSQQIAEEYSIKPEMTMYEEYDESFLLEKEIELLGFYFSNHPVTKYKRTISIKDIKNYYDKNVQIILLIESIKEIKTKNGQKMAFIKFSDDTGKIEGVMFPEYYSKIYNEIKKMCVSSIYCKVEKRLDKYQLIINRIEIFK